MKTDIELLEKAIDNSRFFFKQLGYYEDLDKSTMEAIENLIKAYKELERKLEMFSKQNIEYSKTLENLQKNTIHKDKIREKMEELNISDGLEDNIAIAYLKELLEE